MVTIEIKSRIDPSIVIPVQAHVLRTITSFLPSRRVEALEWVELNQINLADPQYHTPNKIGMLLGAEIYGKVIRGGLKKGPHGFPVAQCTSFGWILSGGSNEKTNQASEAAVFHCVDDGNEILKRFWELESDAPLAKERVYTEEEKRCEEIFATTTERDSEGRYIVRLPFKQDDPDCKRGEFMAIAERRLKGLQVKFSKNLDFKQRYKEVIDEYLALGHMEEVPKPDTRKEQAVYLPHHAVIKEDRDTTKVRVVFDASCKGRNGVSLNDSLMVGPTLQPELRHLVVRWRMNCICIAADIVKMYRQVKVHQDDADFQRLLWKDDAIAETKIYRMLRVTFGTASAPYLAVRALQQVLYDEGDKYPLVASRVRSDFYVDDLMTGCENVTEGVEICRQMNELLRKAGFELQKWTSNSNELLNRITGVKRDETVKKGIDKKEEQMEGIQVKLDDVIKILGLSWDRKADEFRYVVNVPEIKTPVTKRIIIADVSRLFDPLGWVAPCIILAKSFIQELWLAGLSWDEPVPENILKRWCTYREELHHLTNVHIPRWVGTRASDKLVELHGFCDASKIAYAATIYVRVIDAHGKISVALVLAKTKVAPLKQVSIPRLELCGAVLLARLLLDVANVMGISKAHIHAWTDSTIVISWLNSQPCRWKVFVANRVSEILTSLEPDQWSHVSSNPNPIDCASRGVKPKDLQGTEEWFSGPKFLKDKHINYEKPRHLETNIEEIKSHFASVDNDLCENFSSLNKLIRVVAYCKRFLIKGIPRSQGYLSSNELADALNCCVSQHQKKYFYEEIARLKQQKDIPRTSRLRSLNPFLDTKGILRVGGRLEQSQLPESRKHPILISRDSHLATLIIHEGHKQTLHGGTQLTLNYINNKYWILNAKQSVKRYISKCVTCVKNAAVTRNQLMGQVPSVRVTPCRAFYRSGVDFAGPIKLRTSKGRGYKSYKGYICLFVCMSTRAVHVEAVSDLTTEGFLQAFKRFVARRGYCREMWSDNGTNFVGAAAELKKLFGMEKSQTSQSIAGALANNGTTWHFIPPHSPNFGGLWEAGVKSVKHHLKRVVGNSTLSYEELATVLAQIEACLNSRPLSRLGNDINDIDVLTPGHFLVGEPLVTAPDNNFEKSNVSSLRRWQYTQRMLQDFWRKWSTQYLTHFFQRYRWSAKTTAPKLDDVVIIKEDGLPPCRWLYGRIIAEHPGPDNVSRVFTLKTKDSILKRPGSKLCVLPITE